MNTDEVEINTGTDKDKEYKYQELTGKIIGCAFEVHNHLGCGFLEKVYEKALIYEMKTNGLRVERQKPIKITYKDQDVGTYLVDLVVGDRVIVELKTVEFLTKIHKAQVLNYLRASGFRVGLILNFSRPRLEYKRVVA